MIFTGMHGQRYVTSRELGRGGEGAVYDLQETGLVLKIYNEPPTQEKIEKLRLMISMRTAAIETYAAWPVDLVADDRGTFCGFVMRKLVGFVPLHMIFSPMDRKKMFPDKGYNFLVHIARNLATAFFRLHEAGLVIGDVNEGNILINAAGLVAFIDCDSFQVQSPGGYYYCEVGVPRYTPPELLERQSFDQVVRTVNTDSFSMAVLIFQLLFLGRHPFAGKNKLAVDFDEETAIKKREFAYSLENKRKKLFPPDNSFAITNLSEEIVVLFHQSFEQDVRPVPAIWIKALDSQLIDMVTCGTSRLHTYPSRMAQCPWCFFQQQKGILYFLDDSYLAATTALGDIESFVNGFKPELLELKKWTSTADLSVHKAPEVEKRFYRYRTYKWASICSLVFYAILSFALHLSPFAAIVCVFASFAIYLYAPWSTRLQAEMRRRNAVSAKMQEALRNLISEYDQPSDLATYSKGLEQLYKYVHDFRRLPEEYERRRKRMEELLYHEQLAEYLVQFRIDDHEITSFGPAKKTTLFNNGIRNASDISKLQTLKVPGIGPRNLQVLLDWQRQMASGFVYIPDQGKMSRKLQTVTAEMQQIKTRLEGLIRKEYQSVNYNRLNITNRLAILDGQIRDLEVRAHIARLEVDVFLNIAA